MPVSSALSYIVININPVFYIGPLPIHWYGLAYVVGISIGLWAILRYTHQLGLDPEIVYKVFWWAALAGLIGGRLYFVIQQPDLVENYLKHPLNIIAIWKGGMAFFGAIFLGVATVAVVSWLKKLPVWLALDIGAFFAAVGQIFGRLGNLVNGDILGYQAGVLPPNAPEPCPGAPCIGIVSDPHIVPWATVYVNPSSFAPLNTPFHPAAAYEMLMNIILLAILIPLRLRLPRIKMGLVSLLYLAGYAISQIIVFFFRGSEPITPFLGITVFKQAQWTAIFVLIALIPYSLLMQRTSRPWTKEEAEAVNALHTQGQPETATQTESQATPVIAETDTEDKQPSEAPAQEHHEQQTHEQHQAHADHSEAATASQPGKVQSEAHTEQAYSETAEADSKAAGLHTQDASQAEQEPAPEYDATIAAELRTEGIETPPASADQQNTSTKTKGKATAATKPRARANGTGAQHSRRERGSTKKSPEE